MPDYPDLPPVSEDPNQPLPDVAPDSELVPYRIGRKDPGGEYQYTTGYAPRGRPAIALPQGMGFSGAGMPDTSGFISAAFEHLPVDQALQAVEMMTKYIAQRGYMADINAGKDAAVSFAKWAPVGLFRQATGIPEALKLSQRMPTPQRYPGMGIAFGQKFYPEKPVAPEKPIAAVALVDEIEKATKAADAAEASGNTAQAEALRNRAEMLSSQAKGGLNVEFDASGRVSAINTGAKTSAKPTIATASQAQAKLAQYQNATELMNWLETHLDPKHVGVAGNVGEFAVDKTLAQLFPEVADKKRIDARSTLSMAQGLAREIVDSPAGRFSQAERDAVLGALPSTGVFESYPDAVARLQRAKDVLRSRAKVYSDQVGAPQPSWSLSKEEIKARYLAGKSSGLKPESKKFKDSGFLTKEEAADALQRFH